MNSLDWEGPLIAIVGAIVFFILLIGGEQAVGEEYKESELFCLSVTAKTQDMLILPWEERIKALSDLKETDPTLALHVVPATGAATRAWIRGATEVNILQGIYKACIHQVQDA